MSCGDVLSGGPKADEHGGCESAEGDVKRDRRKKLVDAQRTCDKELGINEDRTEDLMERW